MVATDNPLKSLIIPFSLFLKVAYIIRYIVKGSNRIQKVGLTIFIDRVQYRDYIAAQFDK